MHGVFYLFSVRYLKAPSFTVQGVKGTPRVLVAVFSVFGLQLLFTYAPFMQSLFASEALPLDTGMLVVLAGVAVLLILEIERRCCGAWASARPEVKRRRRGQSGGSSSMRSVELMPGCAARSWPAADPPSAAGSPR